MRHSFIVSSKPDMFLTHIALLDLDEPYFKCWIVIWMSHISNVVKGYHIKACNTDTYIHTLTCLVVSNSSGGLGEHGVMKSRHNLDFNFL